MTITNFRRFLTIVHKHLYLTIDLCAEQDVISRARMLNYMEQPYVPPAEKDGVIAEYACKIQVLENYPNAQYACIGR